MDTILADLSVSMTELKRNPAAVMREAGQRPVAVLNHNKAAFYLLEPRLYEALMDELADQELHRKAVARIKDISRSVAVSLDDL